MNIRHKKYFIELENKKQVEISLNNSDVLKDDGTEYLRRKLKEALKVPEEHLSSSVVDDLPVLETVKTPDSKKVHKTKVK